jgi:stage II sporulation protein D
MDGSLRVVCRAGRLTVDGTPYPGDLLLAPGEGGVVLVNETDLESYLPGVLAGEMNRSFPPAALRAQAVAARTYALHRIRKAPGATWHLFDSTRSQRYLGLVEPSGGPLVLAAADTRGVVLQWAGRLLPAYYHSTCGGRTASARDALGGPDLPPLVGSPCAFCGDSPKFRWTARFPLAEAVPGLGLPGPFRTAAVTARFRDGRARTVRFATTPTRSLRATDLRALLGPGRLPSTRIDALRVEGPDLVIEGGGFGHGAGMCQYGARGMARAGAGTGDILSHYYPAANRTRIY